MYEVNFDCDADSVTYKFEDAIKTVVGARLARYERHGPGGGNPSYTFECDTLAAAVALGMAYVDGIDAADERRDALATSLEVNVRANDNARASPRPNVGSDTEYARQRALANGD